MTTDELEIPDGAGIQQVQEQPPANEGEACPPGWTSSPVAPWRRFGARLLDNMVNGVFGFFLLAIILYQLVPLTADRFFSVLEGPGGNLIDVFFTVIIAGIVNAILLATTGSTLGKMVFGIRVRRHDGSALGLGESFSREAHVWLVGLGCGLPLVSLLTMLAAYRRLSRESETSWDRGRYLVLYRNGPNQIFLNILSILLIVVARLAVTLLERLP